MNIDYKAIDKIVKKHEYYSTEQFIHDAKRYIKAIDEGRCIMIVETIAQASPNCYFQLFEVTKRNGTKHYCLNFRMFIHAMDYPIRNGKLYCQAYDVYFGVNYNVINHLNRLGLISKPRCRKLEQCKPHSY